MTRSSSSRSSASSHAHSSAARDAGELSTPTIDAAPRWSGLTVGDHRDWAVGVADHTVGDRAEPPRVERAVTVGAHDEQVAGGRFGDELVGRRTERGDGLEPHRRMGPRERVGCRARQSLGCVADRLHVDLGGHVPRLGGDRHAEAGDDADRAVAAGDLGAGPVEGPSRAPGSIEPDRDRRSVPHHELLARLVPRACGGEGARDRAGGPDRCEGQGDLRPWCGGGEPSTMASRNEVTMRTIDATRGSAVAIEPDRTIRQAAQVMEQAGVGALVVLDGRQVTGIVTDRDLVRRAIARGISPDARIDAVMTSPVITADADGDLRSTVALFRDHAVRRLPLVRDGVFVGMFTIDDRSSGSVRNWRRSCVP